MASTLTGTELDEWGKVAIERIYENHNPEVEYHSRVIARASPKTLKALATKIPKELTEKRPGPGGVGLTYFAGHNAIGEANKIFGPDGWCSEILKIDSTYHAEGKDHVYETVCQMRVYALGVFHDDIGHGDGKLKEKLKAREKSEKEAVTDATKRALRKFGEALGNCLYDKKYVQSLNAITNK